MTAPLKDLAQWCAEQLLQAAADSIEQWGLTLPAWRSVVAGQSVPTVDACEGILWTRVAAVYPTDGSGAPFTAARADWDIPAWAYAIELGWLWCHPVIEEDGDSPDADTWADMAVRDGQYRGALLNGMAYLYPPRVKACLESQRIEPWAPIGPDGGYSGGLLVSTTIATYLATTEDD